MERQRICKSSALVYSGLTEATPFQRGSVTKMKKLIKDTDGYRQPHYIPPKRPYSFPAMLEDILDFASSTLIDNGRLSLWMPTANEDLRGLGIPTHPCLELVSVCQQAFNKCAVC
jgi:tRNA G10  N-methylase Trm11